MRDLFQGVKNKIYFRPNARDEYETRVVSKNRVLDIGGRNRFSQSRRLINLLNQNPNNTVICTDIIVDYKPEIVDDICNTSIKPNSFDGVYCDAVLEHVQEYWKAIDNIFSILKEGGEAFFFVPFIYSVHDLMDYHRFTFTEVARMLDKFSNVKIFPSGKNDGFGWVFWYVLTMTIITKFHRVHTILSKMTNSLLKVFLYFIYNTKKNILRKKYNISFKEYCFYYVYLYMNIGCCAWVKK